MNRKEILDKAESIVNGDREDDYGTPEDSFSNIAAYWSIYLEAQLTPVDVAAMMILLKVSRNQTGKSKADNWIDLAGYAACGGEIDAFGEEKPEPRGYVPERYDTCGNCGYLEETHNDGFYVGPCSSFTPKIDETQSMGKSS